MQRVGYYCWAGPGTVRMTNLKFFNPAIDINSLMRSYDYDYLAKVKNLFGITDFWATYSWGFNPQTEQIDYKFLLDRLDNFHKLNIRVHAYVQGTNLVRSEFPDMDWFCEDERGRPVSYHRGRHVACVNNPGFREFMTNKLKSMQDLGFSGIYVDNMQMGQFAFDADRHGFPLNFVGCNCSYCQANYRDLYHLQLPTDLNRNSESTNRYLEFRTDSLADFIREMGETIHAGNLEFGTNSFDPKFNTRVTYGLDLTKIHDYQDYFLFENHSLPTRNGRKNNSYIGRIATQLDKPVFLVSYKRGIGMDPAFTQQDFDNMFTEAHNSGFNLCLKGSEYFTHKTWHNLYPDKYSQPAVDADLLASPVHSKTVSKWLKSLVFALPVRLFLKRYYNQLYFNAMENPAWRVLVNLVYRLVIT